MKFLPDRGHRNTFITLMLSMIPATLWVIRGVVADDWGQFEFLLGNIAIVAGASAHRARGAYRSNGLTEE